MQHRGHDPDTGGPNRMAKRDTGAIDVEPVRVVPAQPFEAGKDLTGEGFVELDQIHIVE